ncbi:unnamed protein product [Moneuplotes crassus]|uniref:Secreted protein n=1 Tax=Euplotes crassus TaxID=5936 RepID=A0AAD1Y2I3_EUPCR|nr:unnamed protein product [Moneuplotes crassus]
MLSEILLLCISLAVCTGCFLYFSCTCSWLPSTCTNERPARSDVYSSCPHVPLAVVFRSRHECKVNI